jgi:hypothetical protein
VALMAGAPAALAQKMYRCPDGKGGTVFQQAQCGETAAEAEARAKERERLQAEEAKKKAELQRRKDEQIQKGRERDKAYQQQVQEKAAAAKKVEEAEKRFMQGIVPASNQEDSLPADVAAAYPGPWRGDQHAVITSALAKKQVQGCGQFRYKQRPDAGKEFLVNCTTGSRKDHYFVWPGSEAVMGPRKF